MLYLAINQLSDWKLGHHRITSPSEHLSFVPDFFFYAQEGGPDDEDEEDLASEPQEDCCPGGPWFSSWHSWMDGFSEGFLVSQVDIWPWLKKPTIF